MFFNFKLAGVFMKKWLKAIIVVFIILIIFGGLGITAYYRYKDKLAIIGKRAPEDAWKHLGH